MNKGMSGTMLELRMRTDADDLDRCLSMLTIFISAREGVDWGDYVGEEPFDNLAESF
jgi:hypothetical protein